MNAKEFTTVPTSAVDPWPTWADDHAVAEELVAQLTLEEKISLVTAPMGYGPNPPEGAVGSAAHNPGVPRLGIPAWDESDASLGVTNPMNVRGDEDATAFPSGLALGATFDRELGEEQGRALGAEARATGMSVQLAGGMNLVREPRGGRNFEYLGEDALLSGVMAGSAVRGIQSEGVVSTLKHFALNPQETGRVMVSSDLAEPALRESDLLAFQIAVEQGGPRSIMSGYNLVNRLYASENPWLLSTVLKGDWGFRGFVMSDWGGTHSAVHAASAGLDRQSGHQLDTDRFFDTLADAVHSGRLPEARLDDMVTRILTALQSVGALDSRRSNDGVPADALADHATVARKIADRSVVLLKNDGDVLPLTPGAAGTNGTNGTGRIVVLGEGAATGVLSGGGSSTVTPPDADQQEGFGIAQMSLPKVRHRPAPLDALQAVLPDLVYLDSAADVQPGDTAVLIADKWATEGRDNPDLSLDGEQDALISAVAAATGAAGRTVVVLETPGAVTMPWLDEVDAVVAAWYGGSGGAASLADVLTGAVNPSGRLPVTFPAGEDQLPRTTLVDPASTTSNPGEPRRGGFPLVNYDIEGADLGYRWYSREGLEPLFWFGHGLSYTTFSHGNATAEVVEAGTADGGAVPQVTVDVTNTGEVAGRDVVQVYIAPPEGQFRLVGWGDVELAPGETTQVLITADDRRTYASYRVDNPAWVVADGDYRIRVARSAAQADATSELTVHLDGQTVKP